ncbi:NAD(P)H-binding protein [Neobacillus mesonae]|nr:NAD(P)H-binding protein [Neobacillus mesonae]
MTILVTGATGTVGRHLVQQLVEMGKEVRGVSRHPGRAVLPEGVQVVYGDLTEPESLVSALQNVRAMFLILSSDQAGAYLQTDPAVIKVAKEAGVKHVTVLMDYEGNPIEQIIKDSGLEWTLLKPVEFMANALEDWKESIQLERVVRVPFANALSARVHEADIASVAALTLIEDGHHEQSYVLTGPETLTRQEAVHKIAEATGKDIRFVELTEEQARQSWKDQGFGEEDVEFFVQMGKNPPEVGYTVVPTIEQVTGRPAKTFNEWLSEHKHHFM